MKRFIKSNLKVIIAFIASTIMFSGITYAATFNFASGDVEHTKSDGSKTNVKATLNDLYVKASQGDASASQILSGKKALSNGTLLTGTMANNGPLNWNPTTSTKYTVPAGYYSGGTLDSSGAYNAGYEQGKKDGSSSAAVSVINSLFNNSVTSSNTTLFSISCGCSESNGIWDSSSNSADKSANIPLYKYDSNGYVTDVLNMILVNAAVSASGSRWDSYGSSSSKFYLTTNTGNTIVNNQGLSVGTDSSQHMTYTYNLFGTSGLSQ